ncbi:hypothetical protein FOZG_10117 [Fusarium oxysporum Fo47]|uniref:Uncharacterized protein n=1 Tax=Fusarium oxysporum Fo47 TaxID=660027 RepID=W9KAW0_FUSOX|nr:hypothetical protein FOZG_10117 [Fusarium oxysporum Fo47]
MEPIGAAYTLTAAQFAGQVNQRGGNVAVRRAQVDCVLASFEEAKKYMSKDGIEEAHKYLRTGEWVRDQTNAGSHPAYKRQIGDAVERMYEELSGQWGKSIPSDKPFYPRLADPDQERLLIMGDYRWRDFQVGRQASNNTIHVAIPEAKDHAAALSDNNNTNNKQKVLDGYLRAAAQLSAEINPESQLKGRDREVQLLQDQLRDSQQRNAGLQRQVQEQTKLRRHAEHQTKMSQNRLKERQEQLQDAQDQLHETQQELQDMYHRYRESQMLLSKYEEKAKQVHRHISQSQSFSNRALEAASKTQSLLVLGQQQSNKVLNLLSDPIEEFSAAAESSGLAVHDGTERVLDQQNSALAQGRAPRRMGYQQSCLVEAREGPRWELEVNEYETTYEFSRRRAAYEDTNDHWQALKPLLANQPVFSRIAFWVLSFVFLLTKTNFSRLLQARLQGLALLYSQHPSAFTCTVSRRLPLSALVSECDHTLDINMFRAKWENDSNDRKRRWRRTQVYMALRSFAKAKEVMSDRAINELCEYLKRGTWNSTARNASGHPCYKHFKGTSPCPSPFAGPYYPYFFIIQALFPLGEAVKGMYRDLSDLWEMDLDPTRPFYPRLADSEREFSLIMGQKPSPQVPGPGPVTMSSADQPQSPKVKAEQDSGEDNHTLKRKAQPEMLSNKNSPDNDGEQLTSVRSDIKQETSEFQTQLHKDTTGS